VGEEKEFSSLQAEEIKGGTRDLSLRPCPCVPGKVGQGTCPCVPVIVFAGCSLASPLLLQFRSVLGKADV